MNDTEALEWLEAWLKCKGANACVSLAWNPTLEKFAVVYSGQVKVSKKSNGTLAEMISEFRQEVERERGN
jgi:hypothetical protein